jgi:NAD(P)-dependent dehydrogenase (short-subunit alcohol dehydrogenase family)
VSPRELRVSAADMELFAAASGDRNPLHVSAEYARRTPFGEPVVYGVLGALAAFAHLPEQQERRLAEVRLEFRAPLAVDTSYAVELEEEEVRVLDLGRPLLTAEVAFADRRPRLLPDAPPSARRDPSVLVEREAAGGAWSPSLPHLRRLLGQWRLPERGIDEAAAAALAWASYLVGMELPGERATFWKLDLRIGPPAGEFTAEVTRRDERVGLLEVEARLGETSASIAAFVREDSPRADPARLAELLEEAPDLAGKVALVVGGSRGLGAAVAQALALRGARVLVVYRDSSAEAERLHDGSETIEPVQGDAGDAVWCRDVLRPLVAERGGLDLLVCNASPAIRPLSLDPEALDRFGRFVGESLDLVAAALAVFLDELEARGGTAVVVSSSALETLPPDWPHYVTAKAAVEGLAAWAAAAHPGVRMLVVRPPKLLTDQMNSLLGRVGASPVEPVAAEIVRRLGAPRAGAGAEVLNL